MKVIILCLIALLVACATAKYRANFYHAPDQSKAVPEHYIVILHGELAPSDKMKHMHDISKKFNEEEKIKHVYDHGNFSGYAGRFEKSSLNRILSHPAVKYVEEDQYVQIDQSCAVEGPLTGTRPIWHLERVEEATPVYDNTFHYPSNAGVNIFAYVVDTGILITHQDFSPNRALNNAPNFAGDGNPNDCNGHGTHVASSIGGNTYGAAKQCTLIAVKVLNCAGSGTYAGIIDGVNWAATDSKGKGRKSVMNLSLGGGSSPAVDDAVIAAARDPNGIFVVVAAGNSNANACGYSPAGAAGKGMDGPTPFVWSVGASDYLDARATFSNFGAQCVNIFAPGVAVTSAWIGSNTAINTISGTSMAAPQVCGVGAWYWSQNSALSVTQVRTNLFNNFNLNRINFANCPTGNNICLGSHNRLIYNAKC